VGGPVSASERRKGANGELEIVRILRDEGWPYAERSSRGTAQERIGDIRHGPEAVHFEVRRRERFNLWEALEKAEREAEPGHLPIVPFRRNRTSWKAALEFAELCALLKLREL
jgi:hypothetical protein